MNIKDKEIIIYLIIPLIGILFYIFLARKIVKEKLDNFLLLEFFLIFTNYGALIQILFIFFLLQWSAFLYLVYFYLALVAPIMMGLIAYRRRNYKSPSKFDTWAYMGGGLYFVFAPIVFMILYFAN
ncbi:hypothetical protein [Pedobacter psychrodurus]|uniref:hypothetical protein n=1 Tax=Pedobacter psychrodurus TaxID=2530456 RepID=UPI00292F5917|nr:hypothetical protein [Pedobacter psychrodurus]